MGLTTLPRMATIHVRCSFDRHTVEVLKIWRQCAQESIDAGRDVEKMKERIRGLDEDIDQMEAVIAAYDRHRTRAAKKGQGQE